MRRQFVAAVVAVTAMIALAFVIPLALLVDDFAQDRGVNLASSEGEALARSLALVDTTDIAVVESLILVGDPDVQRTVVYGSGLTLGPPVGTPEALGQARRGQAPLVGEAGGVAKYVPVVGAADSPVVRTFVGPEVLNRNVTAAWLVLGLLGLGLLGLAAFIADRLARSIVRPVDNLADAAGRFAEGELTARVDVAGPPEIQTVGRVFNRLGMRLNQLLRAERESVADLSHRLRTPLTALHLEAEQLADSPDAERIRASVDEMQREVDHLIREARRPIRADAESIADLADIVRSRAAFWEPLITDQDRGFEVSVPEGRVEIAGVTADVEAAVDALLGNVISHTDEATSVWVSVMRQPPTLVVDDAGPGFPGVDAAERGVSSAGSTGLGLDIARRTVEASGGTMHLGHRPGGGARVELQFGEPTGE